MPRVLLCLVLVACSHAAPASELTIAEPRAGAYLGARMVRVAGTITRRSVQEVRVNGVPVAVSAGEYQATVELAPGRGRIDVSAEELLASVEVLVDPEPPRIEILEPMPGAFIEGDTLRVRGRITDTTPVTVTHDGEAITVEDDGTFELRKVVTPGAHRARFVATDAVGHMSSAFAAAIVGDLAPAGELVPTAVTLDVGSSTFATLADGITPRLGRENVEPMLLATNPLTQGSWGAVYATGETHDPVSLTLTPSDAGVSIDLAVPDLAIPFEARGPLGVTLDGTAYVERADVSGTVRLSAHDGRPQAELVEVAVVLEGLLIDLDALWDWADRNIVTAAVRDSIERAISDAVHMQLPTGLAAAVDGLPSTYDFDIYGYRTRIEGAVTELRTTAAGLSCKLDMGVAPVGEVLLSAPGPLRLGTGNRPALDASQVGMSVTLDVLNASLFAAWSAGGLRYRVDDVPTTDDGRLTAGLLDLIVPLDDVDPSAPVAVNIAATLPPVVRETDGGLEIHAADLRVDLFALTTLGEVSLLALSVGVRAEVEPFMEGRDLGLRVRSMEVLVDPLRHLEGLPTPSELDAIIVDLLGPVLAEHSELRGFTLPSLDGFGLEASELRVAGNQLQLEGRLRVE